MFLMLLIFFLERVYVCARYYISATKLSPLIGLLSMIGGADVYTAERMMIDPIVRVDVNGTFAERVHRFNVQLQRIRHRLLLARSSRGFFSRLYDM